MIALYILLSIIGLAVEIGILVACAMEAKAQGRDPFSWVILCLFLGPVILVMMKTCLPSLLRPEKDPYYTWTCPKCLHHNSTRMSTCERCGHVKNSTKKINSASSVSSSYWTCSKCLHHNSKSVTICERCGQEKKGVAKALAPQKWVCSKCGEVNNESAKNCINCYEPKPQN